MSNFSPASFQTRLGDNHGYRIDGDFVYLNAEVTFSDDDLNGGDAWALQLWSSVNGFADGLNGVKVAELDIQPLAGGLLANACCAAMPPARGVDQQIALALVAFPADGEPQVRDLAVYSARENFWQPTLVGNVNCTLADGAAQISVEAIANPRTLDNLSGTLSLEVWALDAPYAGGSWTGSPVASLILGVLSGGHAWTECEYSVPAALPVEGAALTVMLREWTPAGYVTRDYRNFAAVPAKVEAAPVAPVKAAVAPAASKPAAKTKAAVAAKPAEAAKAPAKEVKTAAEPAKKPVKKAAAAKAAVKAVSVNTGSEAELVAVKGLPPSVARAIIAARPFASLDDLCKAKGMGPKMLAKVRDLLVL